MIEWKVESNDGLDEYQIGYINGYPAFKIKAEYMSNNLYFSAYVVLWSLYDYNQYQMKYYEIFPYSIDKRFKLITLIKQEALEHYIRYYTEISLKLDYKYKKGQDKDEIQSN